MNNEIYQVTECKNEIYNLFTEPKYEELMMTKRAYIKLMCYIHLIGDYEISGFGRIQDNEITDFKILRQEVRSAYVESDENAVLEFIRSIPKHQLSEWELDWHSHVDMCTSPSGTDWDNYESMSKLRGGKQFPIMIVNKKQSITLMNYISEYRHPNIKLDYYWDSDVTKEEIDEIYQECKADIEKYCTKAVIKYANTQNIAYTKTYTKTYPTKTYPATYYNYKDDCETLDDDFEFCQCCGVELITEQELTTGLCEDCIRSVVKEGEK